MKKIILILFSLVLLSCSFYKEYKINKSLDKIDSSYDRIIKNLNNVVSSYRELSRIYENPETYIELYNKNLGDDGEKDYKGLIVFVKKHRLLVDSFRNKVGKKELKKDFLRNIVDYKKDIKKLVIASREDSESLKIKRDLNFKNYDDKTRKMFKIEKYISLEIGKVSKEYSNINKECDKIFEELKEE